MIPDAKNQELNVLFAFDQQYSDKALINAFVNNVEYQYEFVFNPDSEFQDVKNALLSKQFKIVTMTAQVLRLKVFFVHFEFKSVEKANFNTLKSQIGELYVKLGQQTKKNSLLQKQIISLRQQHQQRISWLEGQILRMKQDKQDEAKEILQMKVKFEQQIKKKAQMRNNLKMTNTKYKFSLFKHQTIVVSDNNTRASYGGASGLILIDGAVMKKDSSIRFLIKSCQSAGYVGVGMGIRNIIQNKKYTTNDWYSTGHGCFLIFDNDFSHCHSSKQLNKSGNNFAYKGGDIIKVATMGESILWWNERTKGVYSMEIKITQSQWLETYFCVYLGNNSVVQIINS